ncbi:Xaa-Pro aminopeptidase [Brevinema andersonii]|uniref:Xaa-Pro aminopeptidase n=1 Tax=Brevinema andersonii TaxID=34097 RepID=A0A1I1E6E1_BREAD|nr:M24 family metallopeptidase [Brevinema andersonii]SFB82202.1 Xaa-Pro aminopeptidase [Brevinema andersonii]
MPKGMIKNPIFEKRLIKVTQLLSADEALLTVHAPDIFYLTGCTGSNNHLLIFPDKVYLFTDGRYLLQVEEQCQVTIILEEIGVNNPFGAALKSILKGTSLKKLKFSTDSMSYLMGKSMIEALPPYTQVMQDVTIAQTRMIKDELEIETIRQNTCITQMAFLYIQSLLKPGITELELAAELEYYCRKQGASAVAFDIIIASGKRAALPHGAASSKKIEEGDLIQFDFGIVKDHYCSDFSRVVRVGEVDSKLLQARQIIEDTIKKVQQDSRCGMTGSEIDKIARDYLHQHGYDEYFVHGLGHSLGLEVHENPRLNQTWNYPITENMVLTVEPGVYFPGLGGVRLEDIMVMRSTGFEYITECGYDF